MVILFSLLCLICAEFLNKISNQLFIQKMNIIYLFNGYGFSFVLVLVII